MLSAAPYWNRNDRAQFWTLALLVREYCIVPEILLLSKQFVPVDGVAVVVGVQ
jgi:hypothetical protein